MSRAIFLPRGRNRSRRKKFDCCISRVSYSRLAQLLASDRARSFFPLSVFITPPSPPPSTPLFSPHPKLVPRTVINRGKTRVALHLHTFSPEFFRVPFQRERLHQKLHQPSRRLSNTCAPPATT